MVGAFKQVWVLARLTVREALRQPICVLLTLAAVLSTIITPLLVAHQLGEQAKLARDGALAFHFLFGVFLGGYIACSTLGNEIRSGTAATVLSKAVSREAFFLAKLAGVIAVLVVFSVCATLATLLSERIAPRLFQVDGFALGLIAVMVPAALALAGLITFFTRRSFASQACALLALALASAVAITAFFDRQGHHAGFGQFMDWRLIPASVMITLALIMMAAIALCLSTRLKTAPTIVILILALFLGLLSDHLLGAPGAHSWPARFLYGALPNWQHFWLADALAGGGRISWLYVGQALPYTLIYTVGVVCLGLVAFRHRQF